MATTKIWAVRARLDYLVRYVANTDKTANLTFDDLTNLLEYAGDEWKTEQKEFVTGIHCQPETAYSSMKESLQRSEARSNVLALHGYQSFAAGEVDAKIAHEIGVRLAEELWGDKFQVLVATHCNTAHFHNHFVVCATSFLDGKRYLANKATYRQMREASDRLCREHGLSVVENAERGKSKHYAEWQAEKQENPTWKGLIRGDIDRLISQSSTDKQFFYLLKQEGYAVKFGKDITVRPPGKERGVKLQRNFGDAYSMDSIRKRILENISTVQRKAEMKVQDSPIPRRIIGKIQKPKHVGGFRGLYFHYCYRMGVFPKNRQKSPAQVHFLYREDLRKLDKINEEARLLVRCRIDTTQQLFSYKDTLSAELQTVTEQRKSFRNELRRTDSPEEKAAIKMKIEPLNQRLSVLRREVKLCESIADRSGVMTEKIRTVEQEKSKDKEEQEIARRKRRSRASL